VQSEEARERKFPRLAAQARPDRIHPDVPGHIILCVVPSQDMVVILELPEGSSKSAVIRERGLLLETVHEIEHVTLRHQPFKKKMCVIGHEAVGLDGESLLRREVSKGLKHV
jgi:hypothetical protein